MRKRSRVINGIDFAGVDLLRRGRKGIYSKMTCTKGPAFTKTTVNSLSLPATLSTQDRMKGIQTHDSSPSWLSVLIPVFSDMAKNTRPLVRARAPPATSQHQ